MIFYLHCIKESQTELRKGFSTLDIILFLQFLTHTLINSKKNLFYAFIDFEQAFDTFWRYVLWHKLLKSRLMVNVLHAKKNMNKDIK